MSKNKLVFVTGTRADFGKLKSLIHAVQEDYDVHVFVTGMHMLSQYGSTYNEVFNEGYPNVHTFINQSLGTRMDIALANTITGFSNYIQEHKPDMIVVHGDRLEALACATVGAFNNIRVAHIEGGEVSGTIDESIRHTVSKLSHVHFVANEEAQQRLIRMGENPDAIFIIGSPDIDVMLSGNLPTLETVKQWYDIPFEKYSIFMYHPVTTEVDALKENITEVVAGIRECKENFVVIYPNNDEGSEFIIDEIETLRGNEHFVIMPSMRFEYFLTLLKHAECIVGNSSAGIREAGIYGTPTVNIGTRQQGRSEDPQIVHVDEHHKHISDAIHKAIHLDITPDTTFGEGNSAELFMQALKAEALNIPVQKQFMD